jgi:hypothetical protein
MSICFTSLSLWRCGSITAMMFILAFQVHAMVRAIRVGHWDS